MGKVKEMPQLVDRFSEDSSKKEPVVYGLAEEFRVEPCHRNDCYSCPWPSLPKDKVRPGSVEIEMGDAKDPGLSCLLLFQEAQERRGEILIPFKVVSLVRKGERLHDFERE